MNVKIYSDTCFLSVKPRLRYHTILTAQKTRLNHLEPQLTEGERLLVRKRRMHMHSHIHTRKYTHSRPTQHTPSNIHTKVCTSIMLVHARIASAKRVIVLVRVSRRIMHSSPHAGVRDSTQTHAHAHTRFTNSRSVTRSRHQ